MQIAPWIDERTFYAANRLTDAIREQKNRSNILTCVNTAVPLLEQLAVRPHIRARLGFPGLLNVAIDRYRWLLSIKPSLGNTYELCFFLGEALFASERYGEAATAFARARDLAKTGKQYQEARSGLDDAQANVSKLSEGAPLF